MAVTIQTQIESLLKDKIGWSASILGSKEIARAVERRILAENSPNLPTYLQKLQTSTQELEELIELLIVPETWFFRDWEPFTFLESYVKSEWLLTQRYRVLRVLSVPCSSGEEPYSIAMTLLNAGLTPNQFQIDAVDISKLSLDKAIEAVYSQNSFRVKDLEFQKLYFNQVSNKYELQDLVKKLVNFMQGNLVDPNFLSEKNPYDVIFCRNVLIYFDDEARVQTIGTLNRLLKNEGLLFLGHAEKAQILESSFVSVKHPFAFAYRKKDLNSSGLKNHEKPPSITNQLKSTTTSTKEIANGKNSNPQPKSHLENAQKLADLGQLSESAIICETYLKQNSTSVEAYILLGQVYQAQGLENKAEQCFQKAIYLEPNNCDALLHLTLLKEQKGDVARAAVLRQRIQRLQKS